MHAKLASVLVVLLLLVIAPTQAQETSIELSENVRLDLADRLVRQQLDRVKEYLADQQWDEAVETLRRVMEESGGKLMGVTDRRFINVRDYCHLQLTNLPPEALELYRSRVDPEAGKLYERGIAQRDRRLLARVVDEAFASRYGDDALLALGEMALEEGDMAGARAYWAQAIPIESTSDVPRTWLAVPDTDLDPAAVRARLILASILEGSPARARNELTAFVGLHPDARGYLGGREVDLPAALESLLVASETWPRPAVPTARDWPTFAGSPSRSKVAAELLWPSAVGWRAPFVSAAAAGQSLGRHPVVAGDLVLVNTTTKILAVDRVTGSPAWGHSTSVIFRDELDGKVFADPNSSVPLGVPRYTMTVSGGRLFARMGSPITCTAKIRRTMAPSGYLICLDLESEGRLLWKTEPEEEGWAFEGAPVSDGRSVFVAMRCSGVQPEVHVAGFDARTGRRQWRQFVAAADMPARNNFDEITHNLLTLERETLYINTNLGAVAALSTSDGGLKWVSLYPRVQRVNMTKLADHWSRDLTPCLFDRGTLLVAPADSPRIFAIDALDGVILWQSGPELKDVVHLLGVADNRLIASGDRVYWIGLDGQDRGKVKHVWPDGPERLGHGRGLLAGSSVLWPTRETIYLLDQTTGQPQKEIPLAPHGITGGNLLVVPEGILITTESEVIQFGRPTSEQPAPAG